VRTAAEQAQLRASVATMFVNLARRSQILVDRLIGHLDRLERGEEDPDRLAELFQLDHLATRMRRNDENLLVLAGADSTRIQREPAPLMDVLRAAQSEVEHYTRIEFGMVDRDIEIAAHAVNDMVHLVAELLDNATAFSPPDSAVVVEARRLGDRAALLVEDRGIGVSPDQLAELNDRLANPPMVDVAVSRMMGLVVVARLAARHGVKVELRPARERGTLADVTLPAGVLVPRALAGRAIAGMPGAGMPTAGAAPGMPTAGAAPTTPGQRSLGAPLALESGAGSDREGAARGNMGAAAAFRSGAYTASNGAFGGGSGDRPRQMPDRPGRLPSSGFEPSRTDPDSFRNIPTSGIPASGGPVGYAGPGPNGPGGSGAFSGPPPSGGGAYGSPPQTGGSGAFGGGFAGAGSGGGDRGARGGGPSSSFPPPTPGGYASGAPSGYADSGFDRFRDGYGSMPVPSSGGPTGSRGLPAWSDLTGANGHDVPPMRPTPGSVDPLPQRRSGENWIGENDFFDEPPGLVPRQRPGGPEPIMPNEPPGSRTTPLPSAPPAWPPVAGTGQPTAPDLPDLDRLRREAPRPEYGGVDLSRVSDHPVDLTAEIPRVRLDWEPSTDQVAEGAESRQRFVDETMELPIFRELESAWFQTTRRRPPATEAGAAYTMTSGAGNSNGSEGATIDSPYGEPPQPSTSRLDAEMPVSGGPASAEWSTASPSVTWQTAADEGWQAAAALAEEQEFATTETGLPRRVPMSQLVPGGVAKSTSTVHRRTPEAVRGLLSAYHRGVQRGRGQQQRTTDPKTPEPSSAGPQNTQGGKEQEA
jgi:hypothetical protein